MRNRRENARDREKAFSEALEKARKVPRKFDVDVGLLKLGDRRVQLIVVASFATCYAWEVRENGDKLRLYRSELVLIPSEGAGLVGYEELEIRTGKLRFHLDRLQEIQLSLEPFFREVPVGRDGVSYSLAIFGATGSKTRLSWWMEGPEQWRPMIQVVTGMVEEFRSLAAR